MANGSVDCPRRSPCPMVRIFHYAIGANVHDIKMQARNKSGKAHPKSTREEAQKQTPRQRSLRAYSFSFSLARIKPQPTST